MIKHKHSALMTSVVALNLFFMALSPSGLAMGPQDRNSADDETKEKDKKKDKDKDVKKDTTAKPSKQEREYQKIKQFSEKHYAENAAFRDEVEVAYSQKKREHSEYAYFINTRDAADEQITRTGDKLKVEDTLYDNPFVQIYLNRVGQSLVPKDSTRLYGFKVVLNPIPEARSLSTGTIYVSSGLLSLMDNEAQLAYALGHEIAHVEKNHWWQDVLVQRGLESYNDSKKQERGKWELITKMGAAVGGSLGSSPSAFLSLLYLQSAVPSILKLVIPNAVVSWDKAQEDEADQMALDYMLACNYDPREVPKFYAGLQRTLKRESRAQLGFIADANRVGERVQQVDQLVGGMGATLSTRTLSVGSNLADRRQTPVSELPGAKPSDPGKQLNLSRDREAATEKEIAEKLAPDLKKKLDAGELIGSSGEFEAVMAELKRDNGIRAYNFDMFEMARDNLFESIMIRSNDPYAHLYYGKVLNLTARTGAEKIRALNEFESAIKLDQRRVLPEVHLHRALAMMEAKVPAQTTEIVASLKDYIELYQREHGGALPPNMDVIYFYMQEAGETTWAARAATNVSTKNIDPVLTLAQIPSGSPEPTPPVTGEAPTPGAKAAPSAVKKQVRKTQP